MTERKILDARWFGNVGIVRTENEGEIRYYIKQIVGLNEEVDKQDIADWGCHFPKDAGDVLFKAISQLFYEDKILYGDQKSLRFVSELIQYRQANAVRRSAQIKVSK